jgi:hypothetical protein
MIALFGQLHGRLETVAGVAGAAPILIRFMDAPVKVP